MNKSTLYYDGQCSLCSAEIRRLSSLSDNALDLVDIHSMSVSDEEKVRRLKVLHFETGDGELIVGLEANIAAWQHTRWGFIFNQLRLPVIRTIAESLYDLWAIRRFERLYSEGKATSGRVTDNTAENGGH
jgi:predicted DCC family thiol-disulfide oxidoreductase YuxK